MEWKITGLGGRAGGQEGGGGMRGLRVMTTATLLHRYWWAVERYDLLDLEMGAGCETEKWRKNGREMMYDYIPDQTLNTHAMFKQSIVT